MMDDDSFASIDISVAFFAAVLVLFVFVDFTPDVPRETPRPTIVQRVADVQATPSTWNPIPERGEFAFYADGRLYLFDLRVLADAFVNPGDLASSDEAYTSNTLGGKGAPEEFTLKISFRPGGLPAGWVAATADIRPLSEIAKGESGETEIKGGNANNCLPTTTTVSRSQGEEPGRLELLTVWVEPTQQRHVRRLLRWGEICGFRLRIEVMAPAAESGRLSRVIRMSPAMFSAAAIFR